jgi:peptide-methionine (S)-S-oxide reductase
MNADTPPTQSKHNEPSTKQIVLGGGCFWCVEAIFESVPGVTQVVSGYAGGDMDNPTYEDVCRHEGGHAEVIQITYDPDKISFAQLVDLFWDAHDPTTLNRQGADAGPQYRSVVFYANEDEKAQILTSKQTAQTHLDKPIVTQVVPLSRFYPAEAYHQNYYAQNQQQPYCAFVIRPKLQKLQKKGVIPAR